MKLICSVLLLVIMSLPAQAALSASMIEAAKSDKTASADELKGIELCMSHVDPALSILPDIVAFSGQWWVPCEALITKMSGRVYAQQKSAREAADAPELQFLHGVVGK